jgi:hypothetical protein
MQLRLVKGDAALVAATRYWSYRLVATPEHWRDDSVIVSRLFAPVRRAYNEIRDHAPT